MSRPRRPWGTDLPGRLPATMLKVIAAELSDSARLTRGKRLHADEAVIDLIVGRGVINAEVQGSRSQPYVVTIETEPGTGVPSKREVYAECSCPDGGTGAAICKHAVATLFALSDEVSIDPSVLERWRGGRPRLRVVHDDDLNERESERDDDDRVEDRDDDDGDDGNDGGFASSRSFMRAVESAPTIDPVATVFGNADAVRSAAFGQGANQLIGEVPPMTHRHHPNPQVDAVLVSALEEITDTVI